MHLCASASLHGLLVARTSLPAWPAHAAAACRGRCHRELIFAHEHAEGASGVGWHFKWFSTSSELESMPPLPDPAVAQQDLAQQDRFHFEHSSPALLPSLRGHCGLLVAA